MQRNEIAEALTGSAGRQGASVVGTERALKQLRDAGHVTAQGNLTRSGVILRGILMREREDEAFGE